MRKQQLTFSTDNARAVCTVGYPDAVVFVFNPIFVTLDVPAVGGSYPISTAVLTVSDGEPSYDASTGGYKATGECRYVSVALCKGKARAYVSRLMELFFADPRYERSMNLRIGVFFGDMKVMTAETICIWGNVAVGERFSYYGAYRRDADKPYWERKLIWFRNFPFMVSMFSHGAEGDAIQARYDGRGYDSSIDVSFPQLLMCEVVDDISAAANENGWDTTYVQGQYAHTRYTGNDIGGLVLYRNGQYSRFYVLVGADRYLYDCWDANTYIRESEMYNDADGYARSDVVWSLSSGRLVRFDARQGDLAELPCGRGVGPGIYEVDPATAFPSAQRFAAMLQEGDGGSGTFDDTFDYTFHLPGDTATLTWLTIDNSTSGHYLRWIDRFGMYQYYLFIKGKVTLKNKLGSIEVDDYLPQAGMYYANHRRTAHVEGTVTCKCSAVSMPEEIYAYVATIVTSPVIDIYCGRDRYGEELWSPVNIVAASHDYVPRDMLHDLEISFTMPDINAQSL